MARQDKDYRRRHMSVLRYAVNPPVSLCLLCLIPFFSVYLSLAGFAERQRYPAVPRCLCQTHRMPFVWLEHNKLQLIQIIYSHFRFFSSLSKIMSYYY